MSETYKSGGLSFTNILTLIFVLCKLTHYIDWSWWWVLSPVLISVGVSLFIWVFISILAICLAVLK
jgi:hypothetical protein